MWYMCPEWPCIWHSSSMPKTFVDCVKRGIRRSVSCKSNSSQCCMICCGRHLVCARVPRRRTSPECAGLCHWMCWLVSWMCRLVCSVVIRLHWSSKLRFHRYCSPEEFTNFFPLVQYSASYQLWVFTLKLNNSDKTKSWGSRMWLGQILDHTNKHASNKEILNETNTLSIVRGELSPPHCLWIYN